MRPLVAPFLRGSSGGTVRFSSTPLARVGPAPESEDGTVFPALGVHDLFRYHYRSSSVRVTLAMGITIEGTGQYSVNGSFEPLRYADGYFLEKPNPDANPARIRDLLGIENTRFVGISGFVTGIFYPEPLEGEDPPPPQPHRADVFIRFQIGRPEDPIFFFNQATKKYQPLLETLQASPVIYGITGKFLGSEYAGGVPESGKGYDGTVTLDVEFIEGQPDLEF